jgi:hypothetical protein
MAEKLSRRDFLKLSALGFGIFGAAYFGADELWGGGNFGQGVEDWVLDSIGVKIPEFDPLISSERFLNLGRAFLVVHRGYLRDFGYTAYPDYWNKSNQLMKYLKESGEPTLLAVEYHHFLSGEYLQDPLLPSCAFLIVTRNEGPEIKKYIKTEGGMVKQDINGIVGKLKGWGISTICCAGEEIKSFGGCLGGMANNFMGEFDLKGVAGCIFPPEPPSILRPVTRELYFDQIAIP